MASSRQPHPISAGLRPIAWLYLIPLLVLIGTISAVIQAWLAGGFTAIFDPAQLEQTFVGRFIEAYLVPVILVILAAVPVILTIDWTRRRETPRQVQREENLAEQRREAINRRTRPIHLTEP